MSWTPGGITRTVALWTLILGALIVAALAFFRGEITLGFFISGIFVYVIQDEVRSYVQDRKTISTKWTDWIKRDPYYAIPATILLLISLIALPIHFYFH